MEAAQAVSTSRILKSSSKAIPFVKLKALLDSRSDRDILEGLRKVVSVYPFGASFICFFSSDCQETDDVSIQALPSVLLVSGQERRKPEH